MKLSLLLGLVILISSCAFPLGKKVSLFDGKSLTGWRTTGKAEGWAAEDGMIVCTVQGGDYLYTTEQFEDFELELEFRIDPGVNSGIFFRWSDLADPVHTGIEMQIIDTHGQTPLDKHAAGAIYDIAAPRVDAIRPAGEWNKVRIRCEGPLVECWLNDEMTAAIDLDQFTQAGRNPDGSKNKFRYAYKDLPRSGHIGFQDHGGKVWYRHLTIRRL